MGLDEAHLDGGVCQFLKPQTLVQLAVTLDKPVSKPLLLQSITCSSAQSVSMMSRKHPANAWCTAKKYTRYIDVTLRPHKQHCIVQKCQVIRAVICMKQAKKAGLMC